ncbi:unnamed protein product [Durusdinium trenchii]|uniref:KOW domain-containing protein n=1 Tax=Durusdinium trenchii TaxID=1381693 RepID=A0ABP0JQ28_9DINO
MQTTTWECFRPKISINFLLKDPFGYTKICCVEIAESVCCPRGVPYAVTHDGRTIRYPDPDVKAEPTHRGGEDRCTSLRRQWRREVSGVECEGSCSLVSVPGAKMDRLDLETGKILDHVKFEPGNVVMISGGNNIGRVGVITHEEKHPGSFEMVHVKDAVGHSFNTRLENVFVIGQGNKPWISLPKAHRAGKEGGLHSTGRLGELRLDLRCQQRLKDPIDIYLHRSTDYHDYPIGTPVGSYQRT